MQRTSRTHVFPAGNALLVHGAGGGAWEWNIWRRVLTAQGWHAHAMDLVPAAAGLAATHWADYRGQVLATANRIAAERPQQLVLIGASLGGLLALSVAARLRPVALVLVNPMPPAPIAMAAEKVSHPAVIPWGRQRSLAGTRRAMSDADAAACLYALRRWRDESGRVLDEARAGIAVERPDCPILILASAEDHDVPLEHSLALAESLAAEVVVLDETSHVGPLLGRRAAACAEQALLFIARQGGPRENHGSPPHASNARVNLHG